MLILEDGSRPSNANSYISLAEADAYHLAYNNLDWAGSDEDKEQALINACRAMELLYGPRYKGHTNNAVQSLLFPRYSFRDNYGRLVAHNEIPKSLRDAQAEIALLALNGNDIFPSLDDKQFLKKKSTTIDVIKQDLEYVGNVPTEIYIGFRKIELILAPLLTKGDSSSVRLGL